MAADQLRIDIEAMIQDAKSDLLSRSCCIYKVRRPIREKNECIYTPTTISIGPFHHGNPKLKDMERQKVIMLKRFTQRVNINLDHLISFVRNLEPKVRASYSEDTNLSQNEFQKLMLVDGVFIVELFWSLYDWTSDKTELDTILRQPKLFSDIKKDLLLLENQLPYFFLKGLYQKAFLTGLVDVPSYIELSYMFFGSFNIQHLQPYSDVELNHFTDLLRLFHLPKELPPRESFIGPGNDILLYSAKQLAEVDLMFKASKRDCPLDLKFSNNVLEVPRILVDNETAIFFHNMIPFEQYHYPSQHYLSDYALLLDCLINSHEDVNVLISNGIIRNYLGDPFDVVKIFDGLSTSLTLWNFNSGYSQICRALNSIGSDPWSQIKPALKRQLLLSITGFVLNMLTLVQTIFSILQVVWR